MPTASRFLRTKFPQQNLSGRIWYRTKGLVLQFWRNCEKNLVGSNGVGPFTSSLSEKRSTAELTAQIFLLRDAFFLG